MSKGLQKLKQMKQLVFVLSSLKSTARWIINKARPEKESLHMHVDLPDFRVTSSK
jgi:hypothetical protein